MNNRNKKEKNEIHLSQDITMYLRICGIAIFIFLLFAILLIKLWNMQIISYDNYKYKSLKQSIRKIRIPAIRGEIYARGGETIVRNRPCFNLVFHPEEIKQPKFSKRIEMIFEDTNRLASIMGIENPNTKQNIQQHLNMQPGLPFTAFKDLNEKNIAKISDIYPPITGLEIVAEPLRDYPYGNLASHVLGYVGYEDPTSAKDRNSYFYYLTGMKGKEGIELKYDSILAGEAGYKIIQVNSSGYIHEEEEEESLPAINGKNIKLTIDLKAQLAVEHCLEGLNASMVILNANSGEVISMVSLPSYNPQNFIPYISKEKFNDLLNNPKKPFLNRATMGSYLPGSIVKPLVALAALETGLSSWHTEECSGYSKYGYGTKGIRCTARYGHGKLTMQEGIIRSCNPYFVNTGVEIGIDAISKMYESAGIGRKTGIEIPERAGYRPSNNKNWNQNETAYISIGQGKIEVTPLQVALYYSAIANGGTVYRPHLVSEIFTRNKKTGIKENVISTKPNVVGKLATSPKNIEFIKECLYKTVHESYGTGRRANIQNATVYGKTGTADVKKQDGSMTKNTWFAGFVIHPVTQQLYSFALVVEEGDSGSGTSAPLVARVLTEWFSK